MVLPDLVEVFVGPIDGLGIPYMVTGGVASVIYGDPRFTRDIDMVVSLQPADVVRFSEAFDPDHFYVPPIDALRTETERREGGHFNVIHRDTSLRADIYLLSDGPLHAWGFSRRRSLALREGRISLAPPEYVIVRKLEYYEAGGSERHLRDVASMIRISVEQIDLEEVQRLANEIGLGDAWAAAQAFKVE